MMVLKPTAALQTESSKVNRKSSLTSSFQIKLTTGRGGVTWKEGGLGEGDCSAVCCGYFLDCVESAWPSDGQADLEIAQQFSSCDTVKRFDYYYTPFITNAGLCGLSSFYPGSSLCHKDSIISPTTKRLCPCSGPSSVCTVVEDPHINSFDKSPISLLGYTHTSSVQWLVKTGQIHIQARFVDYSRGSFMSAIAVGGAMLKGNCVVIPSLANDITWNSEAILTNQTSNFKFDVGDYVVEAKRSEHALLVTDLSKAHPGVEIQFPLGVKLIVNRLRDHVNAAIKMTQQEDDQEGLCGNFNGIAVDDALELSSHRLAAYVPEEESLFQGVALQ
jgi:hypothetical protein